MIFREDQILIYKFMHSTIDYKLFYVVKWILAEKINSNGFFSPFKKENYFDYKNQWREAKQYSGLG